MSADFYVARKPCGCAVWGVRDSDFAKRLAMPPNPVVEIELMPYEQAKDLFKGCPHVAETPTQGVLL